MHHQSGTAGPAPTAATATLTALFDEASRRFPDNRAIWFSGREWTYGELAAEIDRCAIGLAAIGVAKGARVGLCLPNSPYSVICFFAILRVGATVVNFNPLYTSRELLAQIRDADVETMFTMDIAACYQGLGPIVAEAGLKHVIVCPLAPALPPVRALLLKTLKRSILTATPRDDRHISYADLLKKDAGRWAPEADIAPEDIAVLQYTGGTTGISKGAMLSHRALVANTKQVKATFIGTAEDGREIFIGVLPFFHVFALVATMLYAIEIGAAMILMMRFDRDALITLTQKHRATVLSAVPTIFGAINAVAETRKIDLTSLKFCISGGAPLPLEVRNRFDKLTGCRLTEGYGLTECSPVVSVNPVNGPPAPDGSAGLPLGDTTLQIRDPDHPEIILSQGEKGELWVRGPQVMSGYWNRPDETANVLRDGFVRTGDIAYVDADGYLHIVDRLKELILCSGYNVYPRVIEEALYEHEDVAEAVAIGVPDAYRGECPKAFVTLKPGANTTIEALHAFLEPRLSKIELPRDIEIRETLPRTLVGKLSRKALIDEERAGGERHVDA
ncbi:long-chain-fatty-acid--CoA ligase [Martelella soudanensis]|uniref:long-chain-fatty-acid--CoA ligase n=1 Tax=unclassified Martelella TaxID=2629616 RepID=UPI0015E04096|nr:MULTISPECIES: long-chain fatty acid--CoA ligase [unclassified Martelella]